VTSVPLAIDDLARARTRPRDGAKLGAWLLVVTGALLVAGALVLIVLAQRAGVPGDGHPSAGRLLARLVPGACMLVLGALVFAHLPRHPLGWIVCAAGIGTLLAAASSTYAIYSHFAHELPAEAWSAWLSEWASAPIVLVPAVALLLFPDGRIPSRRWRPALWCGLAGALLVALNGALGPGDDLEFQGNPFLSDATARSVGDPLGLGWLLMIIASLAGVAAIIGRRRTAAGEEREQLRILVHAGAVVTVAFIACAVGSVIAPAAFDVGAVAALTSLSVLAAAMGVAILRHRLYGLDVYVDRALVLSGTTLVLGGLYVAAVVLVGRALGQNVDLGVALPATALVAIAFHPVRERLHRGVNRLLHGQRDEPYAAMSQLGRRLGEAIDPAQVLPAMVETIAEALRLPYVAVELSGPASTQVVSHGTPAAGVALRLPLVHAGENVGTLVLGARAHGEPLSRVDRRLLEDFARSASAATSAVGLSIEVQRSRERLVTAREEERRRLRGDLHDGLGPTLAGAVLTIDAARRMLTSDPEAADALLDRAAASVEGTVSDVRRVVYGLRPPALDQLGLAGALRQQATTLSTLACDIDAPDPMPPLPAAVEVAAFRIAQEALTNVVRHADARHATVSITVGDAVEIEVRDDGRGLPDHHPQGVGLISMRERSTELGGSFAITRVPEGGTLLQARLPLALLVHTGPTTTKGPGDQGASE
jgi:two-component system, NarL family, sensor kinase